jgi:hypothetical protein
MDGVSSMIIFLSDENDTRYIIKTKCERVDPSAYWQCTTG